MKLPQEALSEGIGIELRLPGDRNVLVRPGFDRRTLLELLGVLEENSAGTAAREVGA